MLLLVTNMFEQGREEHTRFTELVQNTKAILRDPNNVLVANYGYAVNYVRYFVGSDDIRPLPPFSA